MQGRSAGQTAAASGNSVQGDRSGTPQQQKGLRPTGPVTPPIPPHAGTGRGVTANGKGCGGVGRLVTRHEEEKVRDVTQVQEGDKQQRQQQQQQLWREVRLWCTRRLEGFPEG